MTLRHEGHAPTHRAHRQLSERLGSVWAPLALAGALNLALSSIALALPTQQTAADKEAQALIEAMKSAERGPYSRIRWFCADGTVLPPEPFACAEHGGGVQHGELAGEAHRLAELGYNVGTPLVALSFEQFLDAANNYDRLREIVVQAYLERVDDGWVFRRARFYRGSRQVEDEDAAGRRLLRQLLADPEWVRRHFLLAMELVRAVPHGRAPAQLDRIRQLAQEIGDSLADFQPIRTKVHSYPDSSDILAVEEFRGERVDIDPELRQRLQELATALRAYYLTDPRQRLSTFRVVDPFRHEPWRGRLSQLDDALARGDRAAVVGLVATLSAELRNEVEASSDGQANLTRLDFSLALQEILIRYAVPLRSSEQSHETARGGALSEFAAFSTSSGSSPSATMSRAQALSLARILITGAYGRGLLSVRELEAQLNELGSLSTLQKTSAASYRGTIAYLQRAAQWAQGTVAYHLGLTFDRYIRVEPACEGFSDDLLRSSVLLALVELSDALSYDANIQLGLTHSIFGRLEGGAIQGLNPGIARGILEFVSTPEIETTNYRADRIYVLPQSLPELPQVAGILTLSEGSSLSHLQLLARSLGIPNGVIPRNVLDVMRPYFGSEVVYVVSPLGAVILKDTGELDEYDRQLLAESAGGVASRISIGPARLDLGVQSVLLIDELDPDRADRMVGPKAAGVAELRRSFGDRVAPGLVIPFGAFRAHLERSREPGGASLYDEMRAFHRRVAEMERENRPSQERDAFVERRLAYFRREIERREIDPALVVSLKEHLGEWGPNGSFGVFVRSDTNVEDLPEFSGAGLNLTVPNQVRFADILQAIKRVWASPFTLRAYSWRRSVLQTPEHTYVSVLIQRSVPVDKSGVLITADLQNDRRDWVTVSASEGSGGVVGGESAESLLVPFEGEPILLAQAKAPVKRRLSMKAGGAGGAGGVELVATSGSDRVLSEAEIAQLLELTEELDRRFTPKRDESGQPLPWDVEFGFLSGKLWLFQIRPLASDARTTMSAGLAALDRPVRARRWRRVDLTQPLATGSE